MSAVAETSVPIPLIVGDVLQCARTALDHLAYQLVVLNGGVPTKATSYPILDFHKDYPSLCNRALTGMTDAAKSAIDDSKPYSDNDSDLMLWRLYRLNNVDKHRVLLTVGSGFHSVDLGRYLGRMLPGWFDGFDPSDAISVPVRPAETLFPLKVGDELFVDAPGAAVEEEMKFQLDVALNEPGVVEGEPLLEVVSESVTYVSRLIESFRPHLG